MLNQKACLQHSCYIQHPIPQLRTAHFGESSLKFKASQTWNDLQINLNSDILTYSYSELKKAVFQTYLTNYSITT